MTITPRTNKYLYEIELGGSPAVFEESGQYFLRGEEAYPSYDEIESSDELRDPKKVQNGLRQIDWTFATDDTGFLTHDLHPYPAKFIPQIPGNCIARLSLPGEVVLDPFGGSGTTALEAVRLGRRAFSIDANAVGTLIGKVKTCNLDRTATADLHSLQIFLTTRLVDLPTADTLRDEYEKWIPEIPNVEKWFPTSSLGELAMIRSKIMKMESVKARDISFLALSRIVLSVSFQDSETRYSSRPRDVPQGETLKRFLVALDIIIRNVRCTQSAIRYGVSDFQTADARSLLQGICKADSVDLIVTSPPYGNANDYHLYHRFRLLWLGHDPRALAKVEIGSHLRHQKEATGFDAYRGEMQECLAGMYRVLKPGRYAVLVVGDAIYKKVLYHGAESLKEEAKAVGFESVSIIERRLHQTKRSFAAAGRRATTEKILVLRKPATDLSVWFQAPPYRLWPYESVLRARELTTLLGVRQSGTNRPPFSATLDPYTATEARRLVFTHGIGQSALDVAPTWQAMVENGLAVQPSARKDPKYVTHGLHPYKGKFYPQLAKGLMNLCVLPPGTTVLDPFCGSGTTLLEAYLNGHRAYGCDMNPLAAKIANAKVGILEVNPDVVRDALGTLVSRLESAPIQPPRDVDQFDARCLDEIADWFPEKVVSKINWLLRSIRAVSDGVVRDFLEIVLSSIIRNVSHQDPNDLRIRRRKDPIEDADVFGLYLDALDTQYERIEKFWSIRGHSPRRFHSCRVAAGDSREAWAFEQIGLSGASVDLLLTSPPYATALPYIDTDRLSLLLLFNMDSSSRRPVEHDLIGSREIVGKRKKALEDGIHDPEVTRPESVRVFLQDLQERVASADVGFRRKNMPALLARFFCDMDAVMTQCRRVMRPGAEAMIVIGDNRMRLDTDYERIPTTDLVQDIAVARGFSLVERIDISVTTENLVHIRNAITKNVVLRLCRS